MHRPQHDGDPSDPRGRRPLPRPHPDHLGRPWLLSSERLAHHAMRGLLACVLAAVECDSYWAHMGWDAASRRIGTPRLEGASGSRDL